MHLPCANAPVLCCKHATDAVNVCCKHATDAADVCTVSDVTQPGCDGICCAHAPVIGSNLVVVPLRCAHVCDVHS